MNVRYKWLTLLALPLVLAFGFVGCEVEQTHEGELPEADVDVEGSEMPVVDVGADEIEVDVMEEEAVEPEPVADEEVTDVTIPEFDIITPD